MMNDKVSTSQDHGRLFVKNGRQGSVRVKCLKCHVNTSPYRVKHFLGAKIFTNSGETPKDTFSLDHCLRCSRNRRPPQHTFCSCNRHHAFLTSDLALGIGSKTSNERFVGPPGRRLSKHGVPARDSQVTSSHRPCRHTHHQQISGSVC